MLNYSRNSHRTRRLCEPSSIYATGIIRSQDYPEPGLHVREREAISETLEKIRHRAKTDDIFDETVTQLSEWLVNHIDSRNRRFAIFRNELSQSTQHSPLAKIAITGKNSLYRRRLTLVGRMLINCCDKQIMSCIRPN